MAPSGVSLLAWGDSDFVAEVFDEVGLSGGDDDVALVDHGLRGGVGEVFAGPFDRDDGDAEPLPYFGLAEWLADDGGGWGGLDQRVVVVELHVVQHSSGDQVGDPFAHVMLGPHDVLHAQLAE